VSDAAWSPLLRAPKDAFAYEGAQDNVSATDRKVSLLGRRCPSLPSRRSARA